MALESVVSYIIDSICKALLKYNPDVTYLEPTEDGACGSYSVDLHEPFDGEDVEYLLKDVCKSECLDIQFGTGNGNQFNLHAYWDKDLEEGDDEGR